ncbi:MAG: hypothetical protein HOY71_35915 [Nonomuraea sp.]|nr:hypothetical protein [Nonomuraea sp.]
MNEQRKDILGMLAEGKISADEAERLLVAIERDLPAVTPGREARAKYLRLVMDFVEEGGDRSRLNLRVPLQLLRAGVRLAALIPPRALEAANAEMARAGVPFDLAQLKPEQLEAFVEHLDDLRIELDSSDGQMRIFCE